jgi:hypothetical protein
MGDQGVYDALVQLVAAITEFVYSNVAALDPAMCGGVSAAAAIGYLTVTEVRGRDSSNGILLPASTSPNTHGRIVNAVLRSTAFVP